MSLPDAIERSVETVTGGLRGNPLCLAAVLLSALFGLLTYYSLTNERQEQHARMMRLLDACLPIKGSPATIPDSYLRGGLDTRPQGGQLADF